MSNQSVETRSSHEQMEQAPNHSEQKPAFIEPKLTFVEPKLTKRGDFVDLTEGFFGPFTPPNS